MGEFRGAVWGRVILTLFEISQVDSIHELPNVDAATAASQQRFTCHICGKAFRTKWHCKRHVNDVHENARQFICPADNCGKKFKRAEHLRAHKKIHQSEDGEFLERRKMGRQNPMMRGSSATFTPSNFAPPPVLVEADQTTGMVVQNDSSQLLAALADSNRVSNNLTPLQQLLLVRLFASFSSATPSTDPTVFSCAQALTGADAATIQKWYSTQRAKARSLSGGTSAAHVKKYRKSMILAEFIGACFCRNAVQCPFLVILNGNIKICTNIHYYVLVCMCSAPFAGKIRWNI